MSDYILKVRLDKKEKAAFTKAFKNSGFRTMTEFMRFLINQYNAAMGIKK